MEMQQSLLFRGIKFMLLIVLQGASAVSTDGEIVFVMEGDSVTLHADVKTYQQKDIKWYFNGSCVAQNNGVHSMICTEDQCYDYNDQFIARLKLDHQTGSLTITNINITDSGDYVLKILNNSSRNLSEKTFRISVRGVPASELEKVTTISVKKGESVTLDPGVIKHSNDLMTWYLNDMGIINRVPSNACIDDQCQDPNSEIRDRLKLDNQTGSLTITNTRATDAGFYHLEIRKSSGSIMISSVKSFSITVIGDFGVQTDGESVSVTKGDSVTLHTSVKKSQKDTIIWYFNDIYIAQINGDFNSTFIDRERFRGRLDLNHQTGSLTIINITSTNSGEYTLRIIDSKITSKIFSVSVYDVPGAETEDVKTMSAREGESITLDPGGIKNLKDDVITWYFNDICIAKISEDLGKFCTDVQCENEDKRFRGRLKLDHQTGSLTIMNTRSTDDGVYKLEVNSSSSSSSRHRRSSTISISSLRRFNVAILESGLSFGGIYAGTGVFLVAAAVTAGGIYWYSKNSTQPGQNEAQFEDPPPNQTDALLMTKYETASATTL